MDDPDKKSPLWAVREVDYLFGAFKRYTRFVFFSKWFLGVFAILLMVSLIAWPLLSKDKAGMRITFQGTDSNGAPVASPVMESPEYEGSDERGQQFKITGTRAIQKTPELVLIEKVQSQLIKTNGSWVGMTADGAEYYQKENRIELKGNVTVSDDTGYIFVTPSATIDTKTMHVSGKEKVEGSGPQGNILATGFEIDDNGSKIKFGGQSRTIMHIDKMKQ
jgi:lipopolysaccharide export system protein LptC